MRLGGRFELLAGHRRSLMGLTQLPVGGVNTFGLSVDRLLKRLDPLACGLGRRARIPQLGDFRSMCLF